MEGGGDTDRGGDGRDGAGRGRAGRGGLRQRGAGRGAPDGEEAEAGHLRGGGAVKAQSPSGGRDSLEHGDGAGKSGAGGDCAFM